MLSCHPYASVKTWLQLSRQWAHCVVELEGRHVNTPSYLCHLPYVSKCTHSRVVGLKLEGSLFYMILHRRNKFHPNRSTHGGVMTSYRFLKMASIESQIDFRLRFSVMALVSECRNLFASKFRWDIWIHGWVITTSGLWKRTSTILESYSRFRFWLIRRHGCDIFHRQTKFQRSYDVTMLIQIGGRRVGNLFPASFLMAALVQEFPNLCANQISVRYLNP